MRFSDFKLIESKKLNEAANAGLEAQHAMHDIEAIKKAVPLIPDEKSQEKVALTNDIKTINGLLKKAIEYFKGNAEAPIAEDETAVGGEVEPEDKAAVGAEPQPIDDANGLALIDAMSAPTAAGAEGPGVNETGQLVGNSDVTQESFCAGHSCQQSFCPAPFNNEDVVGGGGGSGDGGNP